VRATTVTVASGAVTITVPATTEFVAGQVYDIGLFTNIPDGTDGATIQVTNGTVTAYVLNGVGDYLRPRPLASRQILRAAYFDDPSHFLRVVK
jgi:hypothetical protein